MAFIPHSWDGRLNLILTQSGQPMSLVVGRVKWVEALVARVRWAMCLNANSNNGKVEDLVCHSEVVLGVALRKDLICPSITTPALNP